MQVRRSVCALDCPDTCSLLINVDQDGRGSKLRGNPAHPITRGFLCGKVAQYLERVYHPQRLLYPLRRVGTKGEGRFVRISWNEALDEAAHRLRETIARHGTESVLPYSYAGTMGVLNNAGMDRRFFHRLGASRLDRTICSSTGGAALTASQGIKLGLPPEDFRHSRLIIAWGANILGTNVHLWPLIVEARRRGATFYVIDPVKNRTGRLADRHFAINPGSDLALALGLAHVILRESWQDQDYIAQHTAGFDEFSSLVSKYPPERVAAQTNIPAAEIEALAREYAQLQPAAIRLNYGVQRTPRGGSAVQAIAALPVLTGAWRHLGGGLQLTTSGAFALNRTALERPDLQALSPLGREARLVNMSQLGAALTEPQHPPVHALVVYNSNPAAIAPHQTKVLAGLRRPDLFTLVLEQFQTDTADHADLVLPVTTFLEHPDLYIAYGHYYLQLAEAALPAPGETKSNVEIFRLLARRMGFTDPCFDDSEEEMMRTLLQTRSSYLSGITYERLREHSFLPLQLGSDGEPRPFASGGFHGPQGRFQFGGRSLAYTPPPESRLGEPALFQRYPFELISAKNHDSMNSTFGHRDAVDRQTAVLELCAADAASLNVRSGQRVRVFNDRGWCLLEALVTDSVPPGVVRSHSTRWNKRAPAGRGINVLTSDRLTDLGAGATFYSCLVGIEGC